MRCLKLIKCVPQLQFNAILRFGEKTDVTHGYIWWVRSAWTDSVMLSRNFKHKGGSAGTRCEFGGNPSHIHTIFEKSLDSPRWNSRQVSNFSGSDACVFENAFLRLIRIFRVLLFDSCSEQPLSSAEITPFLGLKTYTNRMFFPVSASKSYIEHYKRFCNVFPYFKPKFDSDMLFIQICLLLCTPKSQEEQHT